MNASHENLFQIENKKKWFNGYVKKILQLSGEKPAEPAPEAAPAEAAATEAPPAEAAPAPEPAPEAPADAPPA